MIMPKTNEPAEKTTEAAAETKTDSMRPEAADVARHYAFLESAARGMELTVRDDQYAFPVLLDAVKKTAHRRGRFRLIDSGGLDQAQLEWLLEAGADFYTSDQHSRDTREMEALAVICRRNKARLACFIHSDITEEAPESPEPEEEAPVLDHQRLGLAGAYLYISNRQKERNPGGLIRLAEACRRGDARLVYYHQGEWPAEAIRLANTGAWIHVTQRVLDEESRISLADTAAAAREHGGGLIIHLQKKPDLLLLDDVFRAEAFIRFEYAQIHYRSPLKPIQQAAKQQDPSRYAFYLQKDFPA